MCNTYYVNQMGRSACLLEKYLSTYDILFPLTITWPFGYMSSKCQINRYKLRYKPRDVCCGICRPSPPVEQLELQILVII